jgi:hypothetical protein
MIGDIVIAILGIIGLTLILALIFGEPNKYDVELKTRYFYECMERLEGLNIEPEGTSIFCMNVAESKSIIEEKK